ncbi:hypothetical protein C8Q80DRAFT_1265506 [Daedaleopsis nitida]|nr:hypothetical protein C8Q80DRAFT_1265506 [Daedaleopsis nitida]
MSNATTNSTSTATGAGGAAGAGGLPPGLLESFGPHPAETIMGGLLIEVFIACILYGMTTLQSFIYYQNYTNDPPSLRYLVLVVWILETVHTAFCMQFVYAYVIQGFTNILSFIPIDYGVGVTVVCSALVALCVQGYYTWRVWIVSDKAAIWTGIIALFAFARVGFGFASASLTYINPNWIELRATQSSLVTVGAGLGSAALVDLLVALTLTFYLKRGRATVHKQSNTMINKILLYTVNTGAITGTASLICVILFALKKNSLVFLGLVEMQTKLYSNSFLGSLNARSHIRNASTNSGRAYTSENGRTGEFSLPGSRIPVIEVTRQTITHDDQGDPYGQNSYDMKDFKGHNLP